MDGFAMADYFRRGGDVKYGLLEESAKRFVNVLVEKGLAYCSALTRNETEIPLLTAAWGVHGGEDRISVLIACAILHLTGAFPIPELTVKSKAADAARVTVKINGVDVRALHAELLRMKVRTCKMKETLVAMLAEVNDFDMTIGLLEVNTRPVT